MSGLTSNQKRVLEFLKNGPAEVYDASFCIWKNGSRYFSPFGINALGWRTHSALIRKRLVTYNPFQDTLQITDAGRAKLAELEAQAK